MARRTLDEILRGGIPNKPELDDAAVGNIQQLDEANRRRMLAYGNDASKQWAQDNDPQQREEAQRQAAQSAFVPQSLRGTVYDQRLVMPYAQEAQRQETGNYVDKAQQAAMTGKLGNGGSNPTTATPSPSDQLTNFSLLRQRMEAARQLTPEQKMKLAKKRQTEATISAIGDGLSALSNLFYTTQYAPNVQGQGQLSAKNQERWDKYNKEIKDSEKNYADALAKAEQSERTLQRQKAKDDAELELKRDASKRAEQLNRARIANYQAGQEKDENMAALYKAKAEALEAGREKEAELLQAKIDKTKAEAEAARKRGDSALINAKANQTRAAKSGGSGRGRKGYDSSTGKYFAYDKNGKIHWFGADKTAEDFAINEGTWVEDTTTNTTTTTKYGIPQTQQRTQRSGWHSEKPSGKKPKPY